MPHVEKDVEVEAPVERVFQIWSNYEKFPAFMENVKEVRRTGADTTHWVAEAAGQKIEWDAKTMQENNRRVAWTASGESGQSGEVLFQSLGPNKTKVQVKLDYKLASGLQETAAKLFQIDDHIVKQDLKNFKEIAEGRHPY